MAMSCNLLLYKVDNFARATGQDMLNFNSYLIFFNHR